MTIHEAQGVFAKDQWDELMRPVSRRRVRFFVDNVELAHAHHLQTSAPLLASQRRPLRNDNQVVADVQFKVDERVFESENNKQHAMPGNSRR